MVWMLTADECMTCSMETTGLASTSVAAASWCTYS